MLRKYTQILQADSYVSTIAKQNGGRLAVGAMAPPIQFFGHAVDIFVVKSATALVVAK
jgi:hypothetical protein